MFRKIKSNICVEEVVVSNFEASITMTNQTARLKNDPPRLAICST